MDRLGDQLFPGSALALQQHGGTAGRDLGDQVENLEHRLALADDVFEVVALLQRALELDVLFFRLAPRYGGPHVRQQLLVVPGLLDKVRRAGLHGPHRVLDRPVGGDDDHGKTRVPLAKFGQQVDSVGVR